MWPVHRNKGVQITYGTETAGLFNGLLNSTETWAFPRQRRFPIKQLNIIPATFHIISKSEEEEINNKPLDSKERLDVFDKKRDPKKLAVEGIPEASEIILEESKNDYLNFYRNKMYDPTVSELSCVMRIKISRKGTFRNVLLTRATNSPNILVATMLRSLDHDFRREVPPVGVTEAVRLDSEIKQIAIPSELGTEEPDLQSSEYTTLVRTREKVYFFRISVEFKSKIQVFKIGEIGKDELAGNSFSHCCINPYEEYQFGVIDTLGNFGIWEGVKNSFSGKLVKRHLNQVTVNDPADISSFKQIVWGPNISYLLLMSRTQLVKYDFGMDEMTGLVTAGSWSVLLDLKRAPKNEKYCFLLTSTELIIVDITNNFERVLSWKHFINDQDYTLKLAFIKHFSDEEIIGYTCLITSLMRNFTYCIEVSLYEDTPSIINSPYFMRLHPKNPQNNISILTSPLQKDVYSIYQVSSTGELSSIAIEFTEDLQYRTVSQYEKPKFPKYLMGDFKPGVIDRLHKNLLADFFTSVDNSSNLLQEEEEVIQDYADNLSGSINEIISKYENKTQRFFLNEAHTAPSYILSIDELESMLSQLRQHFETYGLSGIHAQNRLFSDMSKLEELKDGDNMFQSYFNFFYQLNFSNDPKSVIIAKILSMELGLTMASFIKEGEDQADKVFEELKETLPDNMQDMVNKWKINEEEDLQTDNSYSQEISSLLSSQFQSKDYPFVASQGPSVRSSSQNDKKRKKRTSDKGGRGHISGFGDILQRQRATLAENGRIFHSTQPEFSIPGMDSQTENQSQSLDTDFDSQFSLQTGSQIERGKHGHSHKKHKSKGKHKKKKTSGFA